MNIYTINLPLKHIIKLNVVFLLLVILSCLFFTNSVFAYHGGSFQSSSASNTNSVTNYQVIESGPTTRQAQVVRVNNRANAELISNLKRQIAILTARISQIIEQRENERQNQGNTRPDQKASLPSIYFSSSDIKLKEVNNINIDASMDGGILTREVNVFSSEKMLDVKLPNWVSRISKIRVRSNYPGFNYLYRYIFRIEENTSFNDRIGNIIITASNSYGSATDKVALTQKGRENQENTRSNERGPNPKIIFSASNAKPKRINDINLHPGTGTDNHGVEVNIFSSEDIIDVELPNWISQESKKRYISNYPGWDYRYKYLFAIEKNINSNNRTGDIIATATSRYGSTTNKVRLTQRGKGNEEDPRSNQKPVITPLGNEDYIVDSKQLRNGFPLIFSSSELMYDITVPHWIKIEKEAVIELSDGTYTAIAGFYIEENKGSNDRNGDFVVTATNRYGSTTERLRVIQRGKGRER